MTENSFRCPKCRDTGWISYEKDGKTYAENCDCGCYEKDIEDRRLKFASIPLGYRDATFKDISTKYYKKPESKQTIKACYDSVKYWFEHIEESEESGKGLYMWSLAKGSGKTLMAAAVTNELLAIKRKVKFTTSMDILDAIRESYDKDSEETEAKLLSDLTRADILIIDDFGTERCTDWVSEKFYQIINKRYINRKITIFTANYDIQDLPYDERISSRIKERSFKIHFPEESCRDLIAMLENKI